MLNQKKQTLDNYIQNIDAKKINSLISNLKEIKLENFKEGVITEISGNVPLLFEVPVEKIDLTFDSPYLFLIRDKDTEEVWFTGTVYEPIEQKQDIWRRLINIKLYIDYMFCYNQVADLSGRNPTFVIK